MKRCSVCKKDLPSEMFYKNIRRADGLQNRCKECDKTYQKTTKKEYNLKYSLDYQKSDVVKERRKINKIKRYSNDTNFKISSKIRSRLSDAIKHNYENGIAVNLLGISIIEYKQYLESLFLPDMNWSNYKTLWEIDHIIEICKFDLTIEENQYICFHYTNTRPLYKKENRKRSKSLSVSL